MIIMLKTYWTVYNPQFPIRSLLLFIFRLLTIYPLKSTEFPYIYSFKQCDNSALLLIVKKKIFFESFSYENMTKKLLYISFICRNLPI